MNSSLDQLSPANRYYLGKLLKKAGRAAEADSNGNQDLFLTHLADLNAAELSQLDNLLYFHQSLSNQHSSSQSNLDHVTTLIFSLLEKQEKTEPEERDFHTPSLNREMLTSQGLVDEEMLMRMPLPKLEQLVDSLRRSLDMISNFVNEQEDELRMQEQTVKDLQQQLKNSNEYEGLILSVELETEQQNYDLLEEALKGQRQRVLSQENLLQIHQEILRCRQES